MKNLFIKFNLDIPLLFYVFEEYFINVMKKYCDIYVNVSKNIYSYCYEIFMCNLFL